MNVRTKWSTFLDQQHRFPTGIAGRVIGERMVRQHAPETHWSRDLLNIQPADRVLELGCGAGQGLALALERAAHGYVAGVDLSATMLRSAARRNSLALHEGRLTLLQADIVALPFAEQHWNKVFSIHTFYFWPEPLDNLLELVHLLAKGGTLAIIFATAHTLPSRERVYWPLHEQAQALVHELGQHPEFTVSLQHGPDSRQFNNVAIVVRKL
jgi:SAM-dependent methyltransferase